MVFSSLTFLFFFLPTVIILYYLSKNRVWRNGVLLIASLLFYSWGEPKYLILILFAVTVSYFAGLAMECYREQVHVKKIVLAVAVVLLLCNLFIFKYLNFVCATVGITIREIVLPIGISFYTFQILSYVIDLYRGKIKVQRNYLLLLLYVSLFPQLIAGPIVRYQTVEPMILERKENWNGFIYGIRRFIIGLAKKVIIANHVAEISVLIYGGSTAVHGTTAYWLAALAYALQIYFDFSGYSDMAIGLGRIFGFRFLENFDHPYVARSVTEFWRRWHISLTTWFKDYVYIPLGGNRKGKGKWIRNILIIWLLTGIWHGAAWNFLFWGLYYAILLLLEKFVYGKYLEKVPSFFRWFYMIFFVVVGWVFFNLVDGEQLVVALKMMFTWHPTDWVGVLCANTSLVFLAPYFLLGIVCSVPFPQKIKACLENNSIGVIFLNLWYVFLLVFSILFILSSSYNPFIYFRF